MEWWIFEVFFFFFGLEFMKIQQRTQCYMIHGYGAAPSIRQRAYCKKVFSYLLSEFCFLGPCKKELHETTKCSFHHSASHESHHNHFRQLPDLLSIDKNLGRLRRLFTLVMPSRADHSSSSAVERHSARLLLD